MALNIHTIVSEPFAENSYILWREGSAEAVVIDPGFEPEPILEFLADRKLKLIAVVNTHGHVDHIAGNGAMIQAFPGAKLIIGSGDAPMLGDSMLNRSMPYGMPVVSPPADQLVQEGDELSLAGIVLAVFDIPGHSPGHVVYVIRSEDPIAVLGGDVLFRGSIGRTDFPGGSFDLLKSGIERVLWTLPASTRVYPGHGGPTTVGEERETNPFVGRNARN